MSLNQTERLSEPVRVSRARRWFRRCWLVLMLASFLTLTFELFGGLSDPARIVLKALVVLGLLLGCVAGLMFVRDRRVAPHR